MTVTVTIEDAERVLTGLRSPDKDLREQLVDEIDSWGAGPLPAAVGERLLRGAADAYPAVDGWPATPNERLITVLWRGTPVDPAVVLEVYPRLDGECRAAALRLLAELPSLEASMALKQLLLAAREDAELPKGGWVLLPLEHAPRHPEVLVDPLVRCLGVTVCARDAGSVLLSYAEADLLNPELRAAVAAAVLPRLRHLLSRLDTLSNKGRWEDEYQEVRAETGLLLDLLGRLGIADDRGILPAAARHQDPWIVLWGIVGLLRLGLPVAEGAVEKVAADAETRLVLFGHLETLGRLHLYPAKHRTQSALAEADMVQWLIYPTELAQAPDEIEEIAILPLDTDDGVADLYVYRFRTLEPHWAAKDGWMVGVAGPYLRSEQPTTRGLGATFSRFEGFESKTIEEHVTAILGTLGDWARAQSDEA